MRAISPGGVVRAGVFGSLSAISSMTAKSVRTMSVTGRSIKASLLPAKSSQPRYAAQPTTAGAVSERSPVRLPRRRQKRSNVMIVAMRLWVDARTLTYQKERIAKLRDEIAQISEANRLWWRQKEDSGGSGRLGTSGFKDCRRFGRSCWRSPTGKSNEQDDRDPKGTFPDAGGLHRFVSDSTSSYNSESRPASSAEFPNRANSYASVN